MRRLLIAVALILAAAPGARASHPLDLIAPVDGPIVRHFEAPPDPFAAGHRGIDIAAPVGSPVAAAAGGVVAFAGQVGGDLFVSIDHPQGVRTTYSFLSVIRVRTGETVEQGALIAASGTGHTTDPEPNLHFGLRMGTEYLDPEPVLLDSIRRNLWRVVSLAG
ncbi:MAG TPA: M23 family metallopeptidase [Actinomycetota bacterium]